MKATESTVVLVLFGVALALFSGAFVLSETTDQQAGIKRTDLQRHDLSATGREIIQVRVELAPGAAFGKHTHPGEEAIYMLEGALEYQVEGRPAITLRQGDVLFIPAGTVHAARNRGRSSGAELATYVLEKGKPTLTMVK